jgi:hypothetical protein
MEVPAAGNLETFYTPARISVKDTLGFGWAAFAPIQTEEAQFCGTTQCCCQAKGLDEQRGCANAVARCAANSGSENFSSKTVLFKQNCSSKTVLDKCERVGVFYVHSSSLKRFK